MPQPDTSTDDVAGPASQLGPGLGILPIKAEDVGGTKRRSSRPGLQATWHTSSCLPETPWLRWSRPSKYATCEWSVVSDLSDRSDRFDRSQRMGYSLIVEVSNASRSIARLFGTAVAGSYVLPLSCVLERGVSQLLREQTGMDRSRGRHFGRKHDPMAAAASTIGMPGADH